MTGTKPDPIAANIPAPKLDIHARDVRNSMSIDTSFRLNQISVAGVRKVNVAAFDLAGDIALRRAYPHYIGTSFESARNRALEITSDWLIDLDTTGITGTTGGRVDGSSLSAYQDWLIWAFYTRQDGFIGIATTTRPMCTGSILVGAAVGTSATFNITSGTGFNFTLNARVFVRTATALAGSNYNQGIVTAKTNSTITILLDATYGALTETNTTLAAGSYVITQTTKFEPRLTTEDSRYPGSGIEYDYAYVGGVQLDASSNIRSTRRRGDLHEFVRIDTCYTTVARATVSLCLARWVPLTSNQAAMEVSVEKTGGVGTLQGYVRPGLNTMPLSSDAISFTTDLSIATGIIRVHPRFAVLEATSVGAAGNFIVYHHGYVTESF